jgi:hypothetical protein
MAKYTPNTEKVPQKDPLGFIPNAVKSRYTNENRSEWGKILSRFGIAFAVVLLVVFFIGKGIWIGGDAAEKSMYHNKIAKCAIEKLGWNAKSITFIRQVSYGEMNALVSAEVQEKASSWCNSSNGFLTGEYRIRGVAGVPDGASDLIVWVATPDFIQTWCGMVIMSAGWNQFQNRMVEADKRNKEMFSKTY